MRRNPDQRDFSSTRLEIGDSRNWGQSTIKPIKGAGAYLSKEGHTFYSSG
jgi:hypothetical protein